jgi:hypothetical protein
VNLGIDCAFAGAASVLAAAAPAPAAPAFLKNVRRSIEFLHYGSWEEIGQQS